MKIRNPHSCVLSANKPASPARKAFARASSRNFPVIVGYGGVNAGGRIGGPNHPSFMTMAHDGQPLPKGVLLEQLRLIGTDVGPLSRMGEADLNDAHRAKITANTFSRQGFPTEGVPVLRELSASAVVVAAADVPDPMPKGWSIAQTNADTTVTLKIEPQGEDGSGLYAPGIKRLQFTAAAALPTGTQLIPPSAPEKSKMAVPRNLWMAMFGLHDAMKSMGLNPEEIAQVLRPGELAYHVGAALPASCEAGVYGYTARHILGERPDTKHMAMSLVNMSAAFDSAYGLGIPGHISCDVAACNTFIGNLYNAARDIENGRRRLAVVGAADAPLYPWVIEPFNVMTAVARDESIPKGPNGELLYAQAPRPFRIDRSGFVPGEGSAYVILADRDLVRSLGLNALGLLGQVERRSDGWKKSISNTGVGDYLALHSVLHSAVNDLGINALRERSIVSCHGSGTKENESSESLLYHLYAKAYGISNWPINAVKSFVGHTMGPAGGDAFLTMLQSLLTGIMPPTRNLGLTGPDPAVAREGLDLVQETRFREPGAFRMGIAVSKGFGGDNGAASAYDHEAAMQFVVDGMTGQERTGYLRRLIQRRDVAQEWEQRWMGGAEMVTYVDGKALLKEHVEVVTPTELAIKGFLPVPFTLSADQLDV